MEPPRYMRPRTCKSKKKKTETKKCNGRKENALKLVDGEPIRQKTLKRCSTLNKNWRNARGTLLLDRRNEEGS